MMPGIELHPDLLEVMNLTMERNCEYDQTNKKSFYRDGEKYFAIGSELSKKFYVGSIS